MKSYSLNSTLLFFQTQNGQEVSWTLEDAFKGTFITGTIGSGKSSASGKTIAKSFLQSGFGGLVLTGKADERAAWVEYAKACGRIDDVLVFSPENPFRFNFLDYELNRKSPGGGQTINIVRLFMNIYAMTRQQKQSRGSEDQFWESALNRLLMRVVELIKLSGEALTIENMYRLVSSAPKDQGAFHDDTFVDQSFCVHCLVKASENAPESHEFKIVDSFWTQEFCNLDEKTRSIILESYYALLEPFMSGILRELFATETNMPPEVTHSGRIVILDLPVAQYLELGTIAQNIYKLVWQQAIERRKVDDETVPNFLWIDEAQFFVNSQQDMLFQSTARSSRTATVLISQNVSNFYAVMSGQRYREMTESLLANLATKIFHAQNDAVTSRWAADCIGEDFRLLSNFQSGGAQNSASAGAGEQLIHQVRPIDFATLRTGGKSNGFLVEAFLIIAGRTFPNNKNFLKVTFDQRV